ncbi:MAG TPA: hypothetical protein VGP68_06175 [Gemmataceae bacterium]|nr:hypothetical protein [Gemmataceae bacterium]
MVRKQRRSLAMAVLVAALATASTASAGPFDWLFPSESQPNSYTPFHYVAPRAIRLNEDVHGPKIDVYPPDRHPEITPTYNILRFPCPAVDAAATLIERASPPATSKFRY